MSFLSVTVRPEGLEVASPDGIVRHVAWGMIERISIRSPDVSWLIEPMEEEGVVIPAGTTGEGEMLQSLRDRFPDLRSDQLTAAMSSAADHEFVVWERDPLCPRCNARIPSLGLSHEERLALRKLMDSSGTIAAIRELRARFGCDLPTAKMWAHHRGIAGQGHEPLAPCPYCGEPLRSARAKQCRFCKRDWHTRG